MTRLVMTTRSKWFIKEMEAGSRPSRPSEEGSPEKGSNLSFFEVRFAFGLGMSRRGEEGEAKGVASFGTFPRVESLFII